MVRDGRGKSTSGGGSSRSGNTRGQVIICINSLPLEGTSEDEEENLRQAGSNGFEKVALKGGGSG